MSRRLAAALCLCTGAGLTVPVLTSTATAAPAPLTKAGTCPAPASLTFEEPTYVDTTRAGGEPLVATLPDGRLLYSAHAGTTHFFAPETAGEASPAFVQNYTGQTYIWTSDDNGRTWQFRPRTIAPEGVPASGFSDPEVAIDSEGNVYFSEINLANVAVSSSADNGSTYALENFFGAVLTDRQWMEADRPGELYFVANAFGGGTGVPPNVGTGHYISKSSDGGKTFTTGIPDREGGSGLGDIRVDKRTGTVYEAHFGGGTLSMAAFRNAREGDLTATDTNVIAEDVRMLGHWPAFDLDPSGNLYITWDQGDSDAREAGIYFASSVDGGRTWSAPTRVNSGDNTAIWPWLAAGDDGRVGLAWLEADVALPGDDAETPGDHGWRLIGAATTTGLGCPGGKAPSFSVATATQEPLHTGTICQGGTTCQAMAIDRRLGDYFSVEVDGTGHMYIGYSDTRTPGAVALPGFVRQASGPALLAPGKRGSTPTATTGQPALAVSVATLPRAVPAGIDAAAGPAALLPLAGGAVLLVGLAAAVRRRRAA